MAFVPDERNLGGRKEIYNRLHNHYVAINHIKPTMDLRKPPKAHVDQGGQYFGQNDFYTSIYKNSSMTNFGFGK
jgi:hypothetical protein